jgi:SWIM zinc finger
MATVTKAPRARKARAPRPAPAETRIPEGWQPGGAHPSRQPVPIAPPVPAGPPVRHGKCSITLGIGGNEYRLARAIAGPPVEGVVTLRKIASDPASGPVGYAVATDGLEIKCTCRDHTERGAICKHIMAIVAVARILAPFAAAAEGGAL